MGKSRRPSIEELVGDRLVVVGTSLDRWAGLPVPGPDFWDAVVHVNECAEEFVVEAAPLFEAIADPGPVAVHVALCNARGPVVTTSVLGLVTGSHVVELYGAVTSTRCLGCSTTRRIRDSDELWVLASGDALRCRVCGSVSVPDVTIAARTLDIPTGSDVVGLGLGTRSEREVIDAIGPTSITVITCPGDPPWDGAATEIFSIGELL